MAHILIADDHAVTRRGIKEILTEAFKLMSEGELLQFEKSRKLNLNEEVYYEIIRQKTASLLASCCAVGASSAGASKEIVEKMKTLGECVGMAFQIKDDLFDYGEDEIGKPLGIDIKEKKVTLPLIYSLNNAGSSERKRIITLVKNHNDDPEKIKQIISFVNERGGLQYAETQMKK